MNVITIIKFSVTVDRLINYFMNINGVKSTFIIDVEERKRIVF